MKIEVRLFARAKDLAGADRIALELPADAKVADLRAALGERVPALRPLLPTLLVAINNDFANDQQQVPATAEIACFPPVSGG